MKRYKQYINENTRGAVTLSDTLEQKQCGLTVIHHNDADGLCAAATLSTAFDMLSIKYRLLAVEKIHEFMLDRIYKGSGECLVYADLGGQSSELIGRYTKRSFLTVILDHHLPGGDTPENVVHINPELFGISGDTDSSGASVCVLFARALLSLSNCGSLLTNARLAVFGVIGAFGDRQFVNGNLAGVNRMLLEDALDGNVIRRSKDGYVIPGLGGRTPDEIAKMLDLLGSAGFYSGCARRGVNFLLGKDTEEVTAIIPRLLDMKDSLFNREIEKIKNQGLRGSAHFEWIDVEDRFDPMGVKSIGLFLELLIERSMTDPGKYLIGFQHLPSDMPGIGEIETSLSKVSARVSARMRKDIEGGPLPDFMKLIPAAAQRVRGIADGCHRFAAASVIRLGNEKAFMDALEDSFGEERQRTTSGQDGQGA
ncbi:MAG: DHH family phosphoesterase [Deltaproteobacteria bacterium]|nr:DHH family phosphoesterase [Deltaproteobacteria bacterium]